jgi:tripartite-type tricarboxylate transporter receptor subunit TctC
VAGTRLLAVLLSLALPLGAGAQETYPSKPVRFILPFPPGGPTDILGRLIAERLGAQLGQPVVTENRGGAGGNVGAEAAAKSAPDGYTIVLVAPSLAISPTLYAKLNYDPLKDLTPISLVATVPNVILTQLKHPATLREFIAEAKAKPGTLNFGSGGSGTSNHLAGELFNLMTGAKLTHVPYKGVNLAMQDVMAGRIDFVVIGVPAAAPHIRAGKLRPLAVIAKQRLPALPEVPTVAEAGHLVRHPRAGGHAAADRRAPERRAGEGDALAGNARAPRGHRHRPGDQHAGGIRRLHPERDRQVGRRDPQGEPARRLSGR